LIRLRDARSDSLSMKKIQIAMKMKKTTENSDLQVGSRTIVEICKNIHLDDTCQI